MHLICDPDFIAHLKEGDRVLMHSECRGTRVGYGTVERIGRRENATASVRLDGDSRPYTIALTDGATAIGFSLSPENYSLHKDEAALQTALDFRLARCMGLLDQMMLLRDSAVASPDIANKAASGLSDEFVREFVSVMAALPCKDIITHT